ncbi:ATP-binding cassette domain-containing protein [Chloroflexota bacterium]
MFKVLTKKIFQESNVHRYDERLININNVSKAYQTEAGEFLALKSVNLEIGDGEFVGVIGKSGSGKSTLINMLSGIDRPTMGEINISGSPIHTFNEGTMAQWRGFNLGIVFQFFQLLPILTVAENVMLPMDFCGLYTPSQRRERANTVLDMVGVADHASKLPNQLSGGEQQRVAIARALANDPPIILADEPTGNLDSKTAELIFHLFEQLVASKKTIIMVTHDNDLAQRVKRTIIIADGEIIEEQLLKVFSSLSQQQLVWTSARLKKERQPAGTTVIRQGQEVDKFHIVTEGELEMTVQTADGTEKVISRLEKGQYFGEMSLIQGGPSPVSVRVTPEGDAETVFLTADEFNQLIIESEKTKSEIQTVSQQRMTEIKK